MQENQASAQIFRPRLWLLPGLTTAAALVLSWSLLPRAQRLWQQEPPRPPHLVAPEAERLQRLLPGQRQLRLPLQLPCPGGALRGVLDAGGPLSVRAEGPGGPSGQGGQEGPGAALELTLPASLPPGPHRLLLEARGCQGDAPERHSHVPVLQLPAELAAPRLQVARGADAGGTYALVRGAPGAEAELLLGEQVVGAVPLLGGGAGGAELPLPLERAHELRARQRVPAGLAPAPSPRPASSLAPQAPAPTGPSAPPDPLVSQAPAAAGSPAAPDPSASQAPAAAASTAPAPSPLSPPPTLAPREQLLSQPSPAAALSARLQVGARELSWSWDLTLPDSYLPSGGPLPAWQRIEGAAPVALRIGPTPRGPSEGFDCAVRDAAVERLGGATRLRGQCLLTAGEHMRTLLFHSGARVHLQVAGDPALHLPATLEVAPGPGARLADVQPPPRPGGRFQLDTGEPGPYLRFLRRTVFPLVDMPEPAALLLHPARRLVEHAQELIGLLLRLLPLMILLPALRDRTLVVALLLLLVGGAGSPLVWARVLVPQAGMPRDPAQIAVAALWELAALCWVVAAVRSRGLLRSLPNTAVLLLGLSLPLVWILGLGHRPMGLVIGRGGMISAGLGAGLALLVMLVMAQLARLAALPARFQAALVALGALVLLMDGLQPANLYVDAVARRLAWLSPVLAGLGAAALCRRGAASPRQLLWPLFLSAVPPLSMDHGLPLGLIAALFVYRLWRTVLAPGEVPAAPPPSPPGPDQVSPEVEAVLLAVGDHPVARLQSEREALEARARRGELAPDAYQLARQALTAEEEAAVQRGYARDVRALPPALAAGTAAGPVSDGARALRLAVAPTILYLLFLLLVKEPFDPGRLLVQLLGSLRQIIQLGAMCFFFGFAFGALPGRNGLIKAMLATLLTVACELPSAVLTWYRPEDVGRGLVRWVGVLGILGWVGLGGFDFHRLRQADRGLLDLARVRGYSRGFALTTSVILAIFTAVVSGVTGRVSALLTSAAFGQDDSARAAVTAPAELPRPADEGAP